MSVKRDHILESIEGALRIESALQAGQRPSAIELKKSIDDLRMSRMILQREGSRNGSR